MVLNKDVLFRCGGCLGVVFFLAGCATAPRVPISPSESSVTVEKKGVQHKVHKGETLWRIAHTYKVSVEDIIQANGIPNAASIEESQLLFIPGADRVETVVPVMPTDKDSDYAWPVKGKVVSYFQDAKGPVRNTGIDIKAVEGEIVKAARNGRVVLADRLAGYGQTVILEHSDGFFTVYAHNAHLMVKLGDQVLKGEKVSQLAREDNLAYLHFEVRKGDKATNPLHYLP